MAGRGRVGVPIRILMVIDGRINTGWERDGTYGFGLGPPIDALRPAWSPFVQF